MRNVFIFWEGYEFALIKVLRDLIILHSSHGKGYTLHVINHSNIKDYIKLPPIFFELPIVQQSDYLRVRLVAEYGGIWLDSDTLVMSSLDPLFDILEEQDGFLLLEGNHLWNGVFGSRKETTLINAWKEYNEMKLETVIKDVSKNYFALGGGALQHLKIEHPEYYDSYKVFKGVDNMYPVMWNKCCDEFLKKPYDNYKTIEKSFQPLIVLVNSVYRAFPRSTTKEDILNNNEMPLSYFIKKSQHSALEVCEF